MTIAINGMKVVARVGHQAIATEKQRVAIKNQVKLCAITAMIQDIPNAHVDNFNEKIKRAQSIRVASFNTTDASPSENNILVYEDEFAQFSQYQASFKSNISPITAIVESSKSNTCLVPSSSK